MRKTIFLDFDGVLHVNGFDGGPKFEFMPDFCAAIRPYIGNFHIVISSSWREEFSLNVIRDFFEDDIQPAVVGFTPVHIDGYTQGGREREILSYCSTHGISMDAWIALDDMYKLFSTSKNLIAINGDTGIGYGDLKILTHFLST